MHNSGSDPLSHFLLNQFSNPNSTGKSITQKCQMTCGFLVIAVLKATTYQKAEGELFLHPI